MDNLALGLTKAITDLLEQSEKRFHAQQSTQETQAKLIDELSTRLASLDVKCQELKNENDNLRIEMKLSIKQSNEEASKELSMTRSQIEKHITDLCDNIKEDLSLSKQKGDETAKDIVETRARLEREIAFERDNLKKELKTSEQKNENATKEISQLKTDIEKLRKQSEEFEGWVKLITIMADKINTFNDFKDNMEGTMKDVIENQTDIAKELKRQRQKLVANSLRPPVKSPSSSTLLNGSNNKMHGSMQRLKQPTKYYDHPSQSRNNFFSDSPDEELSELSDHAEILKKGVDALNDLQRSFERSSFYSDE